jgi:hypothetical protein
MNGTIISLAASLAAITPITSGVFIATSLAGGQMQTTTEDVLCQLEAVRATSVRQQEIDEPLRLQSLEDDRCRAAAPHP